jgi:acetate kinase
MEKSLVLVLNCGSSSIKFAIIEPKTGKSYFVGLVQNIGANEANIKYSYNNQESVTVDLPSVDYYTALDFIVELIQTADGLIDKIFAIGHRVVHGGEKFTHSVVITPEILQVLQDNAYMAPLHNPANIIGMEVIAKSFKELPQAAVFDTAFHQSMPDYAYIYPIPYEFYTNNHVRRYGFHGTSHRFVSNQAAEILQLAINKSAFITAHLGNGCSVAAILNGKSLDTSMGLTPLEGLMMGTRSGDVDPSLHSYLAQNVGLNLEQITNILNKQSGLLGVSGTAADMRQIEANAAAGDKRAILALEIFCYRLAKYIAAMAIPLGRIDALVFTGGMGENSKLVREKTLFWLKIFKFKIDLISNENHGKNTNGIITAKDSVIAMVIPTNEEWLIAQDTASLTI